MSAHSAYVSSFLRAISNLQQIICYTNFVEPSIPIYPNFASHSSHHGVHYVSFAIAIYSAEGSKRAHVDL